MPVTLEAGDVLLYSPTDFMGILIAIKTWTWLSHVETYLGNGRVIAARPSGVDLYEERIDRSLRFIRRPIMAPGVQFNTDGAMQAVKSFLGQPYEIAGLFSFYLPLMNRHRATRICSSVATVFLRAGGCQLFNPELCPDDVSPAQLWQTNDLLTIWDRSRN